MHIDTCCPKCGTQMKIIAFLPLKWDFFYFRIPGGSDYLFSCSGIRTFHFVVAAGSGRDRFGSTPKGIRAGLPADPGFSLAQLPVWSEIVPQNRFWRVLYPLLGPQGHSWPIRDYRLAGNCAGTSARADPRRFATTKCLIC